MLELGRELQPFTGDARDDRAERFIQIERRSGCARRSSVSATTVVPVKKTDRSCWVKVVLKSSQPTCWWSESQSEKRPVAARP